MKAVYSPKSKNYFSQLEKCIGKVYDFTLAYETNGYKYYEQNDKNFDTSTPIKETDLNFDIPENENRT